MRMLFDFRVRIRIASVTGRLKVKHGVLLVTHHFRSETLGPTYEPDNGWRGVGRYQIH